MIASFNKKAKPMGKHQIKQHILNLEGYMREASIKNMEGNLLAHPLAFFCMRVEPLVVIWRSLFLTCTSRSSITESIVEDELKRYKSFSPMPYRKLLPSGNKVSNDPLKWWEEKAAYLPIMSGLAKAYLSIQATSAPSERVFSVALSKDAISC
ncbi:hAT family C-terminal dimerization domain containing protein [Nitzschia inconspicua]|uniref:HAT family C-terminal dimerization domain containing protein n=1 Tax=Nitzschia inconspicua TaxID=303405 RepID=A0A9K3KH38_9STRA|nr:hAT family C-terminal dimerization domain containing protein [Nitzschia inconspicua]